MLATLLPLCVYLILEDTRIRWLWVACFPAKTAGTLATLSRGAFAGLVVMVIWPALTRRIRLGGLLISTVSLLPLVAVGFALFGSVVNERVQQKGRIATKNSQSREALWGGALEMSMDHPITGIGPGRFGVESVNYIRNDPIVLVDPQAHDAYLELLAESGPFALAAFLTFLGISWRTLVRVQGATRADGNRGDERLATALQASLLVAIVGAIFISEHVASPFWVICGFAAAVSVARRVGSDHGPRNLHEGSLRYVAEPGDEFEHTLSLARSMGEAGIDVGAVCAKLQHRRPIPRRRSRRRGDPASEPLVRPSCPPGMELRPAR